MVLESSGAMIWWRHCSTHGEREGKAAFVGWARLILLVVVCGDYFGAHRGTAEGAYLSGRAAAARLMRQVNS